jgi:carbonic anhydrase
VIKVNNKNFRVNPEFVKGVKAGAPGKTFFWFRLSGRHIFYSTNKKDINILDNVYVNKITHATPLDKFSKNAYCFMFKDVRRVKYKICTRAIIERNKWVCQLQKNLGQAEDPICKGKKKGKKAKGVASAPGADVIIQKTITQPLIIIPQPSKNCNEKWDYSNKGRDWECQCKEGLQQSPVNLPPSKKAVSSSLKPIFEYEEFDPISPSDFKDGLVKSGQPIKIRYLNNALRIFHPNMGKVITLDGAVYVAEEIIFHTPSEHTINGQRFDMEMQVIHKGVTTGDIAKTVILSLLFKKKAGVYNKFMDKLDIYNLPNPSEPLRDLSESLFIPYAFLDAKAPDMPIMNPFSFYTYSGSETQPPCAERTILYIASKPIYLGSVALEMFKEAIKTPDFVNETGDLVSPMYKPDNYRAAQKLNGRAIFHYDHIAYCGPAATNAAIGLGIRGQGRVRGHYEKKVSTATEYYYVNSERPSGMPGSYVVSQKEAKLNQ